MVNKERVQLLVDALRSPEFAGKQGKHRLSSELTSKITNKQDVMQYKHCCLGVACIVAKRAGLNVLFVPRTEPEPVGDGSATQTYLSWSGVNSYGASHTALPEAVLAWYGFDEYDPELRFGRSDETQPASWLNDDLNMTFNQLASAFERTYLRDGEASA